MLTAFMIHHAFPYAGHQRPSQTSRYLGLRAGTVLLGRPQSPTQLARKDARPYLDTYKTRWGQPTMVQPDPPAYRTIIMNVTNPEYTSK